MAIPVIKTVREGYDITTAAVRNFTLDSTKNQLKRYEIVEGTATFPATTAGVGTYVIISIPHELGYRPFFMAYVKDPLSSNWRSVPSTVAINDNIGGTSTVFCATTQGIYESALEMYTIQLLEDASEAQDIDYKCIIFIDPTKDAWS